MGHSQSRWRSSRLAVATPATAAGRGICSSGCAKCRNAGADGRNGKILRTRQSSPQEQQQLESNMTNTTTEKLSTCNCAEVFIEEIDNENPSGEPKKRRLPYSQYHNCDYVRERNKYVSEAAIYAQEQISEESEPEKRAMLFNTLFSQKMTALCRHLVS